MDPQADMFGGDSESDSDGAGAEQDEDCPSEDTAAAVAESPEGGESLGKSELKPDDDAKGGGGGDDDGGGPPPPELELMKCISAELLEEGSKRLSSTKSSTEDGKDDGKEEGGEDAGSVLNAAAQVKR